MDERENRESLELARMQFGVEDEPHLTFYINCLRATVKNTGGYMVPKKTLGRSVHRHATLPRGTFSGLSYRAGW